MELLLVCLIASAVSLVCSAEVKRFNYEDYANNDDVCRMSPNSAVCEGNGKCTFGYCECEHITAGDESKRYSGRYCECDDYSCDYFDGQLCGGPSRGVCDCGRCRCRPGFTGDSCSCTTNTETCMAKYSALICNGKGTCECGVCRCYVNTYYQGPTCEECPTCPGPCWRNRACVVCATSDSREGCDASCSHVTVVDYVEDSPGWRLCLYRDARFLISDDGDFVKAQRNP